MAYDLIAEIKRAYADNQEDGKSFEKTEHIRNLDWKAEIPVSSDKLLEALKATGLGYNAFDPINATDTILTVDPEAEVYVAREGSVCLYIKTKFPDQMIRELDADEGDLQPDGTVRIWWD